MFTAKNPAVATVMATHLLNTFIFVIPIGFDLPRRTFKERL